MSRRLPKELEKEICSKLNDLVNGKPGFMIGTHLNMEPLEREAINYLHDIGAFEGLGSGGTYRVTAYGRKYWEKLTAPR